MQKKHLREHSSYSVFQKNKLLGLLKHVLAFYTLPGSLSEDCMVWRLNILLSFAGILPKRLSLINKVVWEVSYSK